jgi:protein SCO1/2
MSVEMRERLPEPPTRRRRWPWLVAVAGMALLVGLFLGGLFRPYVYAGSVIQSSEPAPSMDPLAYENGEAVELDAYAGDIVLLYFGYTHCPDLCPEMLSTVNKTVDGLDEDGERIHTMMVTVDPGRDDPEFLGEYVTHFNPRFRGVWGPVDDVRAVATRYGVHFEYDETDANGNYFVAHTAKLMAIDTDGVLRLLYPVGVTVGELTADMRELLR